MILDFYIFSLNSFSMTEYYPELTNLLWDSLLAHLGSNSKEIPLPKIVNSGFYARSEFNSDIYAVFLDCDDEFFYVLGFIHEGTHAAQYKLSDGIYSHSSSSIEFEKVINSAVTDASSLIESYKKLAWEEGLAYTLSEKLFGEYGRIKNYSFRMGNEIVKIKEEGKKKYARHHYESVLSKGKDTRHVFSGLPTFYLEHATMDSIASIVGYCCVSNLKDDELKKLVRFGDAHKSSSLQFNTSFSGDVAERIHKMIRKYVARGTYFDGIVFENLSPLIPGL